MRFLVSFMQRQIKYLEEEKAESLKRKESLSWAVGTLAYEGLLLRIAGVEFRIAFWEAFLPKKKETL